MEIDKIKAGLIAIGILAALQGVAWICNKDGAITATTFGLIGLISGSIFGFAYAKKE
jgi:hypothetical protein